ncbi:MAG: T9SS type A sorting domain-containing protein [Ignavibacteria bacterium]|nr:T9SS type A sorting domain-containing protein [Ignavibacteria bacterium]
MKQNNRFAAILFVLTCLLFNSANTISQTWNALGSGTNGNINAAIVFNNELIVAGSFSSPGSNIARWNGTAWNSLGTGLNGVVYALTIFNGQLIAAGAFNNQGNNIAAWNGTTWSPVGLGTNDTIFAATVYNNTLRIGGKFTNAGGLACSRLSGWNGTQWFQMPNGVNNGANNTVYALTVFNSDLAIGGIFTTVGNSVNANRVVRYNSGSGVYTPLGSGVDNNAVLSLALFSGQLYVGGSFTTIGGISVSRIARWTGSNWNSVGAGANGDVRSFTIQGSNLIVGGMFTNVGNAIASWNGTAFSTLGSGITGGTPSVNALTVWSNVLIAGGSFTTAGIADVPASNVAGFGAIPAAPTLVSPSDGATGVSVTPLLDWSTVTSASTYGVQVSTNPNFTAILINQSGLTSSQYSVPGGLNNNTTYFWRATAANGLGTSPFSTIRFFTTGFVGIINNQEIPLSFRLYQNYPNPFNPTTKIRFDLPANNNANENLKLTIYDITGKTVRELLNTSYIAGKWEIDFDASGISSGTYFYKIQAGSYTDINKMIVAK